MLAFYLSIISTEEDRATFEKMYRECRDAMYYVAYGILKSQQKAEDAVHDSFLKIIENIENYREQSCPQMKSFCVIVCRNTAIDTARRETKLFYLDNETAFETIPDSKLTDNQVIEMMGYSIIVEKLRSLPVLYHDVMYLHLVDGLSIKELSRLLDLPKETTKKRLQRGRKILIYELRKEGF
jgi:RNA polymerase sigma-70 factor (ECF subfamily)